MAHTLGNRHPLHSTSTGYSTSTHHGHHTCNPRQTPQVLLQDPKERYSLPLAVKQQLTHDTFFMRFALPNPQCRLGLPCGKHVFMCAGARGVIVCVCVCVFV
jgi:nitrate reductase (NAD(P)H)